MHVGSQVDVSFLESIIEKHGPFYIIIDDGSHQNEHVIASFNYLFFKGLKTNGVYVVEDTQTSYWADFGGVSESLENDITMMNYFKKLTEVVNCREYLGNEKLSSKFDYLVTAMHFYHNLILIYKGDNKNEKALSKMYK